VRRQFVHRERQFLRERRCVRAIRVGRDRCREVHTMARCQRLEQHARSDAAAVTRRMRHVGAHNEDRAHAALARGEGIVGAVPSLPQDSGADAFARVADELAGLRHSIDALTQRLGQLTSENATLRARLDQSEAARTDLTAQIEHIIELLADARREVRALQAKGQSASG
jgi:chromosome segregation ATPase